jgi:hypothetical protein
VGQDEPDEPDEPTFPLRADQLLGWAPGAAAGDGARHFLRVVRMRSAFIDSVTQHSLGYLDAVQGRIFDHVSASYENIRLPGGTDQRQFIAAVMGQQTGSRDELPDPAGTLAALQRPDKAPRSRG